MESGSDIKNGPTRRLTRSINWCFLLPSLLFIWSTFLCRTSKPRRINGWLRSSSTLMRIALVKWSHFRFNMNKKFLRAKRSEVRLLRKSSIQEMRLWLSSITSLVVRTRLKAGPLELAARLLRLPELSTVIWRKDSSLPRSCLTRTLSN